LSTTWIKLNLKQGDQIGRFFAYWAIAFFGQFFEITKVAQNFGLLRYFHSSGCVLVLTKNGLGHILGYFFTNSSGHLEGIGGPSEGLIGQRFT
jgi:hypothetical protein